MDAANSLLMVIGYVLIFAGLVGAVIPVLPGPLLIWLGALAWAWGDGFMRVGWGVLFVLGALAIVAWASDLVLTTVVSRRNGASWRSIGGAILGGFAGGLLFSPVPILGTVLGAILGAALGMLLVELLDKRDLRQAFGAVQAYVASVALAALIEMTLALTMVSLFAWRAFL